MDKSIEQMVKNLGSKYAEFLYCYQGFLDEAAVNNLGIVYTHFGFSADTSFFIEISEDGETKIIFGFGFDEEKVFVDKSFDGAVEKAHKHFIVDGKTL